MTVNIKNLPDGEAKPISLSKKISLPKAYSVNDKVFVKLLGKISNEKKGIFHFSGNVNAILNLNCDLCLKPFDFKLDFTIDEIFSKSDDKEEDYLFFSGDVINLEPAVLNNILINMPMKAVCSNNCKGLCGICGHNLNESDCGCKKEYINPEFEKLKALFEESENE